MCGSEWSDASFKVYFSIKFLFIFFIPYVVIVISSIKLLSFLASWKQSINIRMKPRRSLSVDSPVRPRLNLHQTTHYLNNPAKGSKCLIISNSSFATSPKKIKKIVRTPNEFMDGGEVDSFFLQQTTTTTSGTTPSEIMSENSKSMLNKPRLHSSCSSLVPTDKTTDSSKLTTLSSVVTNMMRRRRLTTFSNYTTSVRQKASCLVLIIVVLFIFQWSPLWIFQFLIIFSPSDVLDVTNMQLVNLFVSTLSYSNTIANPVLYMLLTYNFKLYFKKSFNYNPSMPKFFFRTK